MAQGSAFYDVKVQAATTGSNTHSHSVSGSVGSTSLGTGTTDIGNTGSTSLGTGTTDIGNTGSTSLGTGVDPPSSTQAHENKPPYYAVIYLIRAM
jgi:hypothetical protein